VEHPDGRKFDIRERERGIACSNTGEAGSWMLLSLELRMEAWPSTPTDLHFFLQYQPPSEIAPAVDQPGQTYIPPNTNHVTTHPDLTTYRRVQRALSAPWETRGNYTIAPELTPGSIHRLTEENLVAFLSWRKKRREADIYHLCKIPWNYLKRRLSWSAELGEAVITISANYN